MPLRQEQEITKNLCATHRRPRPQPHNTPLCMALARQLPENSKHGRLAKGKRRDRVHDSSLRARTGSRKCDLVHRRRLSGDRPTSEGKRARARPTIVINTGYVLKRASRTTHAGYRRSYREGAWIDIAYRVHRYRGHRLLSLLWTQVVEYFKRCVSCLPTQGDLSDPRPPPPLRLSEP